MKSDNPYKTKIDDFPGFLLDFDHNFGEEFAKVEAIAAEYQDVRLEIGSGSGGYIIEQAKLDPQIFWIGNELRYKRSYRTAEKALKEKLSNLALIRANFHRITKPLLRLNISAIYINFPDPWAKKRWLKNRILSAENLRQVHSLLNTGGALYFKTDHDEYFASTQAVLEASELFRLTEYTDDLHNSIYNNSNIKTEFECLFQSQQKNIHYCKAIRL